MTAQSNIESYSSADLQSEKTNGHDASSGRGEHSELWHEAEPKGSDLKIAVSTASRQIENDLRSLGTQLQSIETGHRAIMQRVARVAEQADERAVRQFEIFQREHESARKQILIARQELDAGRDLVSQKITTI